MKSLLFIFDVNVQAEEIGVLNLIEGVTRRDRIQSEDTRAELAVKRIRSGQRDA